MIFVLTAVTASEILTAVRSLTAAWQEADPFYRRLAGIISDLEGDAVAQHSRLPRA